MEENKEKQIIETENEIQLKKQESKLTNQIIILLVSLIIEIIVVVGIAINSSYDAIESKKPIIYI